MPETSREGAERTETIKLSPADRARALKLFLHRRLDQLFRHAMDPDFTGHIYLKQHSKQGRPFDPETGEVRHGIFEIPME